jgi:hypothetical protein
MDSAPKADAPTLVRHDSEREQDILLVYRYALVIFLFNH